MTTWQQTYLDLYLKTAKKESALQKAGVTAEQVRRASTPGYDEFDREFAEAAAGVEYAVAVSMAGIAVGVAFDDTSRQRLAAARFIHGIASEEALRIETQIKEWEAANEAERQAQLLRDEERRLRAASRKPATISSIEDAKRSSGRVAEIGT